MLISDRKASERILWQWQMVWKRNKKERFFLGSKGGMGKEGEVMRVWGPRPQHPTRDLGVSRQGVWFRARLCESLLCPVLLHMHRAKFTLIPSCTVIGRATF